MDWVVLPNATPLVEVLARQISSTSLVVGPTSTPSSTNAVPTSSATVSSRNDGGGILNSAIPSPSRGSSSGSIPHSTLVWAIISFALAMCLSFMLYILLSHRFMRWRRRRRLRRRPADFFSRSISEGTSQPFYPSLGHPHGHSPHPTPPSNALLRGRPLHTTVHFDIPTLPANQTNRLGRGRRGVRGADTDAGGRRTGPVDAEEHGEGIEKEELPAYESGAKNGPPRYLDVIRRTGAFGTGGGYDQTANTGGGEMELADLNRHPADRPLGDPSEDAGHDYNENGTNRLSMNMGTADGTGLDSRDVSLNPDSRTQEHLTEREIANNLSREHVTIPAPEQQTETH